MCRVCLHKHYIELDADFAFECTRDINASCAALSRFAGSNVSESLAKSDSSRADVTGRSWVTSKEVEILALCVADVECFSRLPGKAECFDLPMLLLAQLVAISDVRRERNKYEAFLQRASIAFPWVHSFLEVLRERGGKSAVYFSSDKLSLANLFLFYGTSFPQSLNAKPKLKKKPKQLYVIVCPLVFSNSLATVSVPMYGSCLSPTAVTCVLYDTVHTTTEVRHRCGFSDNNARCPLTARPGCVLHALVFRCQVSPSLLLAEGIPCRGHLSPLHYGWSRLQRFPPPASPPFSQSHSRLLTVKQTA